MENFVNQTIFLQILFIYFWRGEGREKERKKNINVWSPLKRSLLGNLAHNPGMCPDWERNPRPFAFQARAQSTELHQLGLFSCLFKKDFIYLFIFMEREGEKEREKHQCVVASHMPTTGDLACNPPM